MTPDQEALLRQVAAQIRAVADQLSHTSDRVDAIWDVLIGSDLARGLIEVQRLQGEQLAEHRKALIAWEILSPPRDGHD